MTLKIKILSYIEVHLIMYLYQFGQNQAIGSEDRVQTRLWKLDQGHKNLFVLAVLNKYLSKFG